MNSRAPSSAASSGPDAVIVRIIPNRPSVNEHAETAPGPTRDRSSANRVKVDSTANGASASLPSSTLHSRMPCSVAAVASIVAPQSMSSLSMVI